MRGLVTFSPGFESDLIEYEYDDLALVNLHVGLRSDRGWELSVFAKNLFDEIAVRAAGDGLYLKQTSILNPDFSLSPGPSLNSGYRQVNVNSPCEVGVSLRVSF